MRSLPNFMLMLVPEKEFHLDKYSWHAAEFLLMGFNPHAIDMDLRCLGLGVKAFDWSIRKFKF